MSVHPCSRQEHSQSKRGSKRDLRIQIAQSGQHLRSLGPKLGISYELGALRERSGRQPQ